MCFGMALLRPSWHFLWKRDSGITLACHPSIVKKGNCQPPLVEPKELGAHASILCPVLRRLSCGGRGATLPRHERFGAASGQAIGDRATDPRDVMLFYRDWTKSPEAEPRLTRKQTIERLRAAVKYVFVIL
jgi:hypothetical protein